VEVEWVEEAVHATTAASQVICLVAARRNVLLDPLVRVVVVVAEVHATSAARRDTCLVSARREAKVVASAERTTASATTVEAAGTCRASAPTASEGPVVAAVAAAVTSATHSKRRV